MCLCLCESDSERSRVCVRNQVSFNKVLEYRHAVSCPAVFWSLDEEHVYRRGLVPQLHPPSRMNSEKHKASERAVSTSFSTRLEGRHWPPAGRQCCRAETADLARPACQPTCPRACFPVRPPGPSPGPSSRAAGAVY